MREIKFRGKKKNGSWLFGDLVQRPPIALIFPLDAPDSQDNYIVDLKTVGQFTGLTDKNAVEIYEGDILSDWNEVDGNQVQSHLQVFWCNDTGAWKLDNSFNQDKSSGDLLSEELLCFSYEITGNIYENPELK